MNVTCPTKTFARWMLLSIMLIAARALSAQQSGDPRQLQKEGIAKMRVAEERTVTQMQELVGGLKHLTKIHEFEKKYFEGGPDARPPASVKKPVF